MKPPESLPPGYWSLDRSQAIVDKTQPIRLAPDLSQLSAGESSAVAKLLEVGKIFQGIYEDQRHPQALSSARDLAQLDKRMGAGAVTQNQRDELMNARSVVKRATPANLQRDLAMLTKYPVLDTLHPGLRVELESLLRGGHMEKPHYSRNDSGVREAEQRTAVSDRFYGAPYSVAYADELMRAYGLLNEAAAALARDDPEFAGYLRNRARDLLSDDYESGDAAWVTGHFKNLNAQIGPYETYDDELYGVKTFFAFSLLLTRQQETTALREAMKGLQGFEDSLPYGHHKKIREDIPVGVYDVIGKMLAKVLEVQYAGDKAGADRFIDQYAIWNENLHGVIAKDIRAKQRYRFRLFKYAALDE